MSDGVVIAGGGLAAQRCCETLRAHGHDRPIRIVCGEPHAPYDRPPLSKELLAGQLTGQAVALRPSAWYEKKGVDLLLGTRATGLDLARRRVDLSTGHSLRYESLLVATGSRPRTLALVDGYRNAGMLRTVDDALTLREALVPGARLAVVGAGFVGLEVAATARELGVEVTIVEALDAPLVNQFGAGLGRWFADLHRAEGCRVLVAARLAGVSGRRRRLDALKLDDGRRLDCDHALIGIGVDPDTGWLAGTGLDGAGVQADAQGRTEVPGVYAAGDAARPWDPALGRHVRTEHWEAAARQGAAAARAMLGLEPARAVLPSFWSDQYGVRIQYAGRAEEADRIAVDGDLDGRDFEALFTRDGVPVAVLLVGRPRALAEARRRVQAGLESLTGEGERR